MGTRAIKHFREVQGLSPWLVFGLSAFTAVLSIGVLTIPLLFDAENFSLTEFGIASLITTAFSILTLALLVIMKLETEVRADGLWVCMFPVWPWKQISLSDGVKIEAVVCNFKRECGGMKALKKGANRAYAIQGNRGLKVEYPDGRHTFIGSQRVKKLEHAVAVLLGAHS